MKKGYYPWTADLEELKQRYIQHVYRNIANV